MKELTFDAVIENIERVTDFVNGELEEAGCPVKTRMQIDIAVDELVGNIARYAYAPQTGTATVRVETQKEPPMAEITFIDHGTPYDPLKKEDPDVTLPAEERSVGGLGIYLVKKSMDQVVYEYRDGKNILKIQKRIEREP